MSFFSKILRIGEKPGTYAYRRRRAEELPKVDAGRGQPDGATRIDGIPVRPARGRQAGRHDRRAAPDPGGGGGLPRARRGHVKD